MKTTKKEIITRVVTGRELLAALAAAGMASPDAKTVYLRNAAALVPTVAVRADDEFRCTEEREVTP